MEEAPRAINADDVIEKGECSYKKNYAGYNREQDRASFRNGYLFMRLLQLQPDFQFSAFGYRG
jgi:hypothetical protein